MNLHHVDLFLAVVDAGGFTAAGERLGVAQPGVSAAVRSLEDDLGARLINRDRGRLTLTPEGTAFLRHARGIMAQVSASRREVAGIRALETGHLSVGAPPMVAGYLLPRVIAGFLSKHPGLRLTVEQAGAEEIAERVLDGRLDLGVIADWRTPDSLATRLLQVQPMVACVGAGSPLAGRRRITWTALFDQPLILFPRGYYQRSRVEEAAERLGRSPTVVVEAESIPLIIELVRRGHGVATLLAAAARRLPGVRALELPTEATVPVALCRRVNAPASVTVEAFHDYLVDHLKSRP